MSNLENHAQMEFRAAGWTDESGKFNDEMQEAICKHVLELLRIFADEGHSGTTAPYTVNLFKQLAMFEPIVPLTGEDWEWIDHGYCKQNKRCNHVFMVPDHFNGQAYDSEAVIFWDWYTDPETGEKHKLHFTSSDSARPITFPYTPKREYQERNEA